MAILGKTSITELDLIQPLSNENIANNFITVNGTKVSLGGSVTTPNTVYTHPTSSGNKHIPSGGSSGQFLGWSADGTAKWVNNPNTDSSCTQSGHYTPSATASTLGATSGNNYIRGINLDSKKHVISVSTGTPTDTNTWRPVYNGVDSTDTSSAATANAVKTAYDKAVSAYNLANGKTSNVGTVTSVKVTGGTGLSGGGTVTSSGTITLNHAAAYTGTSLTKSTSGANYYLTAVTLSMDGLGHVTGLSGSESYDDDANTHYTTRLYAGASGTAAHSAVTNPYLKVTDDNTYRNQVRFVGGGATTITSDSAGTITITSTDTNTDTNYYLTGVTGSGNGTATFAVKGYGNVTWDASHSHPEYSGTGHTHSYLPLSGGEMLNQNLVKNLNADLLDGYTGSAYSKTGHTHAFSDLTSTAHTHSGYASSTHSHAASAITGGTSGYFLKADSSGNGVWTSVTIPSAYSLPTASSSTKGGIKVGSFLSVSSEVLSVSTGTTSTTVARGDHGHSGYLTTIENSTFGSIYYGSQVIRPTSMSASNGCYLGNSSYKWNGVYTSYINGVAVPASPAFSDESCTKSGHYNPGLTASTAGSSSAYVKVIGLDGKGHVTGVTTGTPSFTETYKGTVTSVKVTGGTGLSSGGTITDSGTITINHAAATTATTLNTSGANYYITGLTLDGLGHVTGISQSYDDNTANTDSACTLSGHYTPSSSTTITAKTSGADYYVTGVTLNVDSKGHVTAMSVSSSVDDKGSSTSGSYLPLAGGTLTGGVTGTTMKLTGDLRLSGSTNYGSGRSIYFGDGSNAYISEITDDEITIFGSERITLTTSYEQTLYLADDGAYFNCAVYSTSDERLKDFCDEIDVDFDKLKNIPKSYFTWKSDENKKLQIGTSAQKVKELYPELVGGTDEETLSVDYAKLSIVALKAIDVLHDENEKLKSIIEKMDERIAELEKKLGE